MAGPDWLKGFLSRHPELSIRKPEATNIARITGFNKTQVDLFFEIYRNALISHEYNPMRVWNMDETGISNVHKPTKIIATKGSRGVGKITSEKGKTVTVICASNAAGSYIPPMFIFPRKRMDESLMNDAPRGAIGHCPESGWTDEESFIKWLKHFSSIVKPSKEEKHIIVLDGHHSHKTLQAVEFARANGIEMLTLPPHCTHKMQPLDCTFFKALKSGYNAASDTWMVANRGKRITFYDVAEIFAVAYNKVATVEKSVNGFRVCGLWPFNNLIFSDEDFVKVSLDEHAASIQSAAQDHAVLQEDQHNVGLQTTQQSIGPQITQESVRPQTIQQSVGPQTSQQSIESQTTQQSFGLQITQQSIEPQTTLQSIEPQTTQQSVGPQTTEQNNQPQRNQDFGGSLNSQHGDELTLDHDTPSTSAASTAPEIIKAKRVLFDFCSPKPNHNESNAKPQRKRRSTSRRTLEQSQLLTSSPYKLMLKEKKVKKAKNQKTVPPVKRRPTAAGKRRKKIDVIDSDSDEETWPCLVCGEPFSNSKPGEKGVHCFMCKLWAHEACTLGELVYVCQSCSSDDDDEV